MPTHGCACGLGTCTVGVPASIGAQPHSRAMCMALQACQGVPRPRLIIATLAATRRAAQALASARTPLMCTTLALLHKLRCVVHVRTH